MGTYISAAPHIMRTLGWPTETHLPWDVMHVPGRVPVSARRHAIDQTDSVVEHGIESYGVDKQLDIKQTLAAGYPIVFGAHVTQSFIDLGLDPTPQTLTGKSVGGHAMLMYGYDDTGVFVLNSWGADWGFFGRCALTWGTVVEKAFDLRAISVVRRPTT